MQQIADPAGFLGFLIGLVLSLIMIITVMFIDEWKYAKAEKKALIKGEK